MKTKVISFDLDGTLTDSTFANFIWLEEIPRLYATKNNTTIDQAKKIVKENYNKVGNEKLEWYNIEHWLSKFNINKNPTKLLHTYKNKIKLFDDVNYTLQKLSKQKKKLIIISNARREFIDLEIQQTKIEKYFDHIISATSDFKLIKNKPTVFLKACKICNIAPQEMTHIGDDYKFDYLIPKKTGIKAIFLNREIKQKTTKGIQTLKKITIQ